MLMVHIWTKPLMEMIKNRMFDYFLKKYLGDLLLDSQSVKNSQWIFSEGKLRGRVGDFFLDSNSLNAKISNIGAYKPTSQNENDKTDNDSPVVSEPKNSFDLPIVFTEHAYIKQIEVEVPWAQMLTQDCHIRVDGAKFEFRFNIVSASDAGPMIEHLMASSMNIDLESSSMQFAEELFESARKQETRMEGLDMLTDAIESVLKRIQFTLTDTTIVLTDKKQQSKLELHVARAIWHKDDNEDENGQMPQKENSQTRGKTSESSTASGGEGKNEEKEKKKKFVRTVKIMDITIKLNGSPIVQLTGEHSVRLTLGDFKSIQVFFSSLVYAVLTPAQLHEILKIFETPEDGLVIDPNKINFEDLLNQRVITEEEYKKIEEQMRLDREKQNNCNAPAPHSSNNLDFKANQIWSSGNEPEDAGEFLPFPETNKNRDADKTRCEYVDIDIQIPGIVLCLLDNTADPMEAIFPDFKNTLVAVCQHLDERFKRHNHLRVCLLNPVIELRKQAVNCTLSEILFSQSCNNQLEHILFNEPRDHLQDNFHIYFDLAENELTLKSHVTTYVQFDLTLVERLESFLQINGNQSIFDLSDAMDDSVIRLDPSKDKIDPFLESYYIKKKPFVFKMNIPTLIGRLFFPVPDMRAKHVRTFSEIRDDTLETTMKNCMVTITGNTVTLDADFADLSLNTKYVATKKQFDIKYLAAPLIKLNGSEIASELLTKMKDALIGEQLAQFRSLGPSSKVEMVITFGAKDTDLYLDNDGFKVRLAHARNESTFPDLLEESFYKAAPGFLSDRPSVFQTKSRYFSDKVELEKVIAPNNRQQSADYINCSSLVSQLVVQMSVPQMIIVFSNKDQLNNIYNRFANDIALWKPFNLYITPSVASSPEKEPEVSFVSSDVTESNKDVEFQKFDQNVHKLHQEHRLAAAAAAAVTPMVASIHPNDSEDEWEPTITIHEHSNDDDDFHHFEIADVPSPEKFFAKPMAGKGGARSGMDESTDTYASFHSTAETPSETLDYFTNALTFMLKVREAAVSLESPELVNEELVEGAKEVQNLTGTNLVVSCVVGMSKCKGASRFFVHADDLSLCVSSSTAAVTRTQAMSCQNRQVRLISVNKLLDPRKKCHFNAGFEVTFETANVKRIKIALQLQNGLLLQPNVNQFANFWNFLNLTDDLIEGYIPSKVIIDLHVNLMNVGVLLEHSCPNLNPANLKSNYTSCSDCEHPLELSQRPALFISDELNIICLLMEGTEDNLLRFIFEATSLMFAKQLTEGGAVFPSEGRQCLDRYLRFGPINDTSALFKVLQLDQFVCAVDFDCLEINMKMNDGRPKQIKVNNNVINIRGCTDLLTTLCCFSQRFTGTGDDSNDAFEQDTTQTEKQDSECKNKPLFDETILEDEEQVVPSKKCGNCDTVAGFSIVNTSPSGNISVTNCTSSPQSLDESSFFILGDDDFGTGIKKSKEPEIRYLSKSPIKIIENFYIIPKKSKTPKFREENEFRFLLDDMSICLHLYGGQDFYEDFKSISEKPVDSRTKASEHSSSRSQTRFADPSDNKVLLDDSKLAKHSAFEKIALNFGRTLEFYAVSSFAHFDPNVPGQALWEDLDLTYRDTDDEFSSHSSNLSNTGNPSDGNVLSLSAVNSKGGYQRNNNMCVKTKFQKILCLFDTYKPYHSVAWRFLFGVNTIEILDCVSDSQINKMLYEYVSDSLPRRNAHMFTFHATTHRVFSSSQTMNIGPDGASTSRSADDSQPTNECTLKVSMKPLRINLDQDTIMFLIEFFNQFSVYLESASVESNVGSDEPGPASTGDRSAFGARNSSYNDTPEPSMEDNFDTHSLRSVSSTGRARDPNRQLLYIKSFLFSPDVPIKLDYQGKRVDFDQDIKKNQLPSLLGGVGPTHTFVQLFQGIRDLIWMPIDQYRRDRRIVRGLQKGFFSFSTSSTMALLELSSRTLRLIEFTAQSAHDFMSGNSLRRERMLSARHERGLRTQQPRDVREGALTAYNVISDGFSQAFRNLTGGHSRHNSSTLAHIIRELPANVLLPIIHSSQATSNVLLGVRNQMTPQARKEDEDKWKS